MNEDDPTDVAYERFARSLWQGHLLEYPVLGTRDSINATTPEIIRGYWERRYTPKSMVVAVAGNVRHQAAVDLVSAEFGGWSGEAIDHDHSAPPTAPRVKVERRDTEQAHIVLGGEGLTRDDDRRFAFGVLTHIMGGGMSSRLFRAIRETRGLAYAVYMFRWPFADSGAYGVYVGTTPSQTAEVLKLVNEELDKAVARGISGDELERAKGHTKGSLALSLEDPNSRMSRLGRNELAGMEHLSVDEIVARVDAVTTEDVQELAQEVFSRPKVIGATGPFDSDELEPFVT